MFKTKIKGSFAKLFPNPKKAIAYILTLTIMMSCFSAFPVKAAISQTNIVANIYSSGVSTGGVTPTTEVYQKYTYTFTATQTQTPISILFRHDPAYFSFDDISVKPSSGSSELITNGSFENLDSSNKLLSWSLIGTQGLNAAGVVENQGSNSGARCWFDGAVGGFDGLQQTITTTVGSSYTLSFYLKADSWCNTQASSLDPSTGTISQVLVYAGPLPGSFVVTPSSNDAGLSSVAAQVCSSPTGGNGSDSGTPINWAVSVADSKSTLGQSDIAAVTNATFKLYSDAAFSSEVTGTNNIALTSGGATTAYIKVTAQDTTTVKYYAVTINRAAPLDSTAPTFSVSGNPTTWTTSNVTLTVNASDAGSGLNTSGAYSYDNGSTWTTSNTQSFSTNGTVNIKVKDNAGNISSQSITIDKIDKTNPTVTATDADYSWRTSNFSTTINYSDDAGSGINTKQYAVTNSTNTPNEWTSANTSQTVSINNDGQWYIHYKVTDSVGNSVTGYYGPYKLDKVAPTGNIAIQPNKTLAGYDYIRNQIVSIELTGSDSTSLVSQMRFANSESDLANATWEAYGDAKSNYSLTSGNGVKTVYFQMKDNAGNISSVYSDSIYFDNTTPKLTISAPSQYVAKSGDVLTYTVTFTDNSKDFGDANIAQNQGIDAINLGIDKVILSQYGNIDLNQITKTIENVSGQPLKRLIKLSLPSNMTGEGSINLKVAAAAAEDKAGNISDETLCGYSFSIDNVAPTNQNKLLSKDLYVKGGAVITLDSTSLGAGGLESDSVRFAPINYNGIPANTTTITSTHGASLYINAPLNEGEYYLYIVDSAGNMSGASSHKLIVDNSGPIVTIAEPSKTIVKGDSEVEYLVTFANDATLDSITNLFKKSKIGLETTGSANAAISIESVPENDRQRKIKLSYFTGNGSIDGLVIGSDICRDSIDNMSVQITKNTAILVDSTVPTVPTVSMTNVNGGAFNKFLNFITFKNFCKEAIKVSLQASDLGGSNLSKIYYKLSENDDYTAVTPDAQGKIIFELPVSFKGNVWTYSEDSSGNTSALVKSDGTISENIAPTIVVTPADLTAWSKGDTTLNVNVGDNEGVKEIRYSVDGTETVIDMVTGFTDKQDSKSFSIPVTGDSKGHNVQINVVDLAGNNSATYNGVVKIDTTAPTISSVAGNPSDWTKDSVTLTVNANDAVSGLEAKAYSFDGGSTWQTENTKTYDVNTNGIVIKVKDNAGNIATYSTIDITKIDKTAPQNAVIGNASSYVDGKWFNEDQTINASFTSTAGCSERLQYKVYTAATENTAAWKDGESVAINAEGQYTVSFRVIDYLERTSEAHTVKVNLDKTAPTDLTISLKGNFFKTFLNKITFGMFSKDSVDVNITTDSNISGTNYIEYQLVDTSKGESYDAVNGKWVKYTSLSISPQFKGVIYARAMDNAGNLTAVVSSDGLAVDNVQPTSPVIAAIVDGNPYAGEWTSKDVVISASGASALAGIDHYEYKFGTDGTWITMPNQTGAVDATSGKTINDKLTITQPVAGTYYFRAVSISGVIGEEIKQLIKHENTVPTTKVTSTGTIDAWTKDSVKFNVSNTNENILCPVTSWIKIGNGDWTKITDDDYTFDAEINEPVMFKTVTAAGIENIDPKTYNVMIDKTAPVISGAEEDKTYYIGRVITIVDNSKAAYTSVYKLNNGSDTNLTSGNLISGAGSYGITVTDQAGNVSTLGFTVKALPTVAEVLYTSEWDNLIKDIRSEFDTHNDLPEPYKINTDNTIKDLENRFKLLDTEVKTIKQEVVGIKSDVSKLPAVNDGLIAMIDTIQNEYDKIAGNSSTLTTEEKAVLVSEKNDLKQLLDTIKALKDKNADIINRANAIPIADDGLIAQRDAIKAILDEIAGLTNEQKTILKPTIDALNALLDEVKALQAKVDDVKTKVEAALKGDGGLVSQRDKIKALLDEISKLTPEQKSLLKQQIDSLTATLQSDMEKLKGLDEAAEKLQILFAVGDNADSVTKAMFLANDGSNGTSITWNSSDTNIVTDAGRVTRPDPKEQNKTITLTASIRDPKTNEVIKKQFKLTVKKLSYLEAACKQLTQECAFTFDSTGDTWESVTNKFLLLGKGAYDSTITWTSSKPSIINITSSGNEVVGTVTRPENQDEDVILTATITKDGATATKTFLMTVKQKNITKQSASVRVETNTAATFESSSNAAPVSVNIKRTTLDNSQGIIDTLIVTEKAITALTDNINPLAQDAERTVTINMPQPTDGTAKATEQAVEIPASAVQAMAERNAVLEVKMGEVKIQLNTDELKELNNRGTDLYFKVVPIKDATEQSKLGTNTKANAAVMEIAKSIGNGVAVPQGVPYTVETNYSGFNTKLLVPFTGMTIPTENRAAFLASLRVYIEHTDGTKEAKGGTIVYKDGIPVGIEITIDRFSGFQIFSVEQPKANTALPKTGSIIDFTTILALGALLMLTGFGLLRYRRKKTDTNKNY